MRTIFSHVVTSLLLLVVSGIAQAQPFAYISHQSINRVSVINTATDTVVATVAVGTQPFGIGINPAGTRVYVANHGSQTVSVIDTANNSVLATVVVGSSPYSVAVNPAGTRAYVPNSGSNNVSVINTANNTVVATVAGVPGPNGVAINPAGTYAYVANRNVNTVTVIDTSTNSVVITVAVGTGPIGVAFNPGGTRAFVTNFSSANVSVINTATNTVVKTIGVGNAPVGFAVNPAGTRAYVANYNSSNVSIIDLATETVVKTLAVGASPVGVSVNPAGTRVYVANQGSANVSVIDTATETVVNTIAVGSGADAFGIFIAGLVSVGTIPAIVSGAPPAGLTDRAYSFTPVATGTTPITWSIPAGALPPGLSLNSSTGNISGTPTSAGFFTFTLRATNSAGQANLGTSISIAVPIISAISISPANFDFGNQNVGSTSPAQIASVSNTGNGPFDVRSVNGIGDFGFTSTCAGTIQPGGGCTVSITFSPLTPGPLGGIISVNTTAQQGSGGISLSGTGISVPRANIVINPASLVFGDQAVGTSSAPQAVFISNTGLATMELRNISIEGTGYALGAPDPADNLRNHPGCGGSIVPGASCILGVSFSPTATGSISAGIVITHNATLSGDQGVSRIGLSGNATPRLEPLIRISGGLTFSEQVLGTSSAAQNVSVTNAGTAVLNIGGISVSGANPGDFSISANTCGSLIPNAACSVAIRFTPSSPVGVKTANLVIASNATNATGGATSVGLSGTAIPIPAPVVRLSAASVGFGQVLQGNAPTQSVTVTNIGGRVLNIGSVGVTGDYSQSHTCAAAVEPNQSCTITVTFTPQGLGNRDGVLSIGSNAIPATNTVDLSGTGCRILSLAAMRFIVSACGN